MFGNSIKNTFKATELSIKDDKNFSGCSTIHNGCEKSGCIHKREIYLDKINNKLNGSDTYKEK